MTLKDLEDLVIMYESYQKYERVFQLLYGDMDYAVGLNDGIFGLLANWKTSCTEIQGWIQILQMLFLDNNKLSPEEKAKLIIKS